MATQHAPPGACGFRVISGPVDVDIGTHRPVGRCLSSATGSEDGRRGAGRGGPVLVQSVGSARVAPLGHCTSYYGVWLRLASTHFPSRRIGARQCDLKRG